MSAQNELLSEREIIDRILNGERKLYEILVRRNNQRLYRAVKSYLKDDDDVQDAMQNAFVNAYLKLDKFRGDASFSTWLIRIGINEALKHYRRLKKNWERHTELDLHENKIQSDRSSNPENRAILNENREMIEKAIEKLPLKYRTVFVLREIEGLSVNEVAEALDISPENVKVRTHRAKAMLQDELYGLAMTEEVYSFGNAHCDLMTARVTEIIMNL